MEILLAWAAYLTLGVAWLVFGWSWIASRLPRPARLAILWFLVGVSLVALAVSAQVPHDYRPTDLTELGRAGAALFIELMVAVSGGTAALVALGRRSADAAGLRAVGTYLAGVGLVLYWMLDGEASLQAPCLLLVGTAMGAAAAYRLARLPRYLSVAAGLASGLLVMLAAETLRNLRLNSHGSSPGAAPRYVLLLAGIEATILLLGGALLARRRGRALAGPVRRAGLGLAGTGLVLVLRGPGEWLPHANAGSTTLYGLPLTLLVVAVGLGIAGWPAGARRPWDWRPAGSGQRYALVMVPLVVLPLLLAGLVVLWHPAPDRCSVEQYAQTSPLTPAGPAWASSPDPASPRGAPDVAAFDRVCPYRTAGPAQLAYAIYPTCKWAPVDANYPLVQASGILREIDVSPADSPWLHTSHDVEFDMAVDPASTWLVLGGGGPGALLHVEAETGPFPAAYRPVAGERVTVAGRWIFDCGHDGFTEIHPAAVVASERDEWRTELQGSPQQVRVLRVWMNNAPGFVDVPAAPFDTQVALSTSAMDPGATPIVRVVAGSPAAVRWRIEGTGSGTRVAVHLAPPAQSGSAYFELLLGYRDGPPPPGSLVSYTVTFDRLAVRDDLRDQARDTARAMMGGIPVDLIDPQLGLPGTGHWYMDAIVDHAWRSILADAPVESGGSYSLAAVPPVQALAPGDEDLLLAITGYAENDPSDGVQLASGRVDGGPLLEWEAGRPADLCGAGEQTFTPPHGAWTLSYHVSCADPPHA